MTSEVSVVIVSYNTQILSLQAVRSVLENTENVGVVVVDNASPDGSAQALKACFAQRPQVQIIENSQNLGYGHACNIGAKACEGPYLVIMNSDCRVNPGWFPPLKQVLDSPQVFAVAPKLVNDANKLVGCGVVGTNNKPMLRGWMADPSIPEFNKLEECISLSGALFACNRGIFDELGGFDERFFHYYEETHLLYTARAKGYKVMYQPASVCYHRVHGSCTHSPTLQRYFQESKKIFESMWGPIS